MKKVIPIGLFGLLMYQTLGYVLACVTIWWQAEHDLTERLLVYRSTDSLIEFQIPLIDKPEEARATARTTADGFAYRDHFYEVVSMEIRHDTLFILGVDFKHKPFLQTDLLAFLYDHIAGANDSQKKTNQFLKLLLKEYSLNPRFVFRFLSLARYESCPIPEGATRFVTRALTIHSPPPEA